MKVNPTDGLRIPYLPCRSATGTTMENPFRPSRFPQSLRAIVLIFMIALTGTTATLTEVTDFGNNPGDLGMFLYIPDNVAPNPAVLVGLHWCHGTAEAYFNGNQFHTFADKYGFIMICPESHTDDQCFDVHSTETLTHDGGGASQSVAAMVSWVIANSNADSSRVFVTGHSGGGMMTNVMAGSYPDVFAAAAASAGVPFGCFAGGTYSWNDDCAKGRVTKTGEEWKEQVLAAYPGYTGPRPRIQLWHGANDDVLYPANFDEAIKQWTAVLGVSSTPSTTESDQPFPDYTRTRYTDTSGVVLVEAIRGNSQPHNIRISDEEVIRFFGLDEIVNVNTRSSEASSKLPVRKTSVTVTQRFPGEYHISVYTRPGTICADLYDVRGKRVFFSGTHRDKSGHSSFVINGPADRPLSPAVYLLSIKVHGIVVHTMPLTLKN